MKIGMCTDDEILDKLQKVANRETASRNALMEMKNTDYQLLLDYITKLQEELKYQKEAELEYNEKHTKLMQEYANLQEENKHLNDLIENALKSYEEKREIIDKAIEELFELKDLIYKPETREINFDVQNKISSIIKTLGSDKE